MDRNQESGPDFRSASTKSLEFFGRKSLGSERKYKIIQWSRNYMDTDRISNIPSEMKEVRRWNYTRKSFKEGKQPLRKGSKFGSSNFPNHWMDFTSTLNEMKRYKDSNTLSFALGDGWIGIDFDKVLDSEGNWIDGFFEDLMADLIEDQWYVEYSMSGKGFHAIKKFDDLGNDAGFQDHLEFIGSETGINEKEIEFYHKSRFFATTGKIHPKSNHDFNGNSNTETLNATIKKIIDFYGIEKPKPIEPIVRSASEVLDDDQILEKLFAEEDRGSLWNDYYYNGHPEGSDKSRIDMEFMNKLAWWAGKDPDQMYRIFRSSALYRSEKGEDYLIKETIPEAIRFISGSYNPMEIKTSSSVDTNLKPKKELDEKIRHGSSRIYKRMNRENRPIVELNRKVEHIDSKGKTTIRLKPRDTSDIVDEIEGHLGRIDPLDPNNIIFRVRNALVVLKGSIREEDRDTDLKMVNSNLQIKELTKDLADSYLEDYIDFRAYDQYGDLEPPKSGIPKKVTKDLLEKFESDSVREIYGTVQCPYYTRSWNLVKDPGWNAESKMYYDPFSAVEIDTNIPVEVAIEELMDLLDDFPFDDPIYKVNTIAMWITMMITSALPGGELRPLFPIIANVPESGKTTLAQMISSSITGQILPINPLPEKKEELRKTLETCVLEQSGMVLLDNAEEKTEIGSPTFASFITAEMIRFRKLGGHSGVEVPNNFTWTITGNEIKLNNDLTKRSCFIELKNRKSFENRTFRVDNLVNHVLRNRSRICSCVCSIIEKWKEEGKPKSEVKNRFKEWGKIVGGIMEMIDRITGITDEENESIFGKFMKNQVEAQIRFNEDEGTWIRIVKSINNQIGLGTPWKVADVQDIFYIPDGRKPTITPKEDVELNLLGEIEDYRKHFELRKDIPKVLGKIVADQAEIEIVGNHLLIKYGKADSNVNMYKIVEQKVDQIDLLEALEDQRKDDDPVEDPWITKQKERSTAYLKSEEDLYENPNAEYDDEDQREDGCSDGIDEHPPIESDIPF